MQVDFGYFGPPEEHLEWTEEEREVTYITPDEPSSEICGEVAATFAASAIALRETGKPSASNQMSWLASCHLQWTALSHSVHRKTQRGGL